MPLQGSDEVVEARLETAIVKHEHSIPWMKRAPSRIEFLITWMFLIFAILAGAFLALKVSEDVDSEVENRISHNSAIIGIACDGVDGLKNALRGFIGEDLLSIGASPEAVNNLVIKLEDRLSQIERGPDCVAPTTESSVPESSIP